MPTLVDQHRAVHALLEERLWQALEALVLRDRAAAAAAFSSFARLLAKHMAFEDVAVLPRYAPHAPADGPGRLDHVQGDHVILKRHVEDIGGWLAALPADAALRTILAGLPALYRILQVLEHHTLREERVYGAIEEHGLSDDFLRRGLADCLVDDAPAT
jgi:hypothetical protein